MTAPEWLAAARQKQTILRAFIAGWHPESSEPSPEVDLPITAPGPENARRLVLNTIENIKRPVERFDQALQDGDTETLYRLLDQAWFGVPESTSCWEIPGFKEAVDLMDDPPDYEPEDESKPEE